MKKIFSCAMIVAMAFALVSCGGEKKSEGGKEPKTVTATRTTFTSGDLSDYIEFTSNEGKLYYEEVEDVFGAGQKISLELEVKLTDVHKDCAGAKLSKIGFIRLLCVATIDLKDEKGNKLTDLEPTDEAKDALKELLASGEVGKTIKVVFASVLHNAELAPKYYANTSKFTPALTADIQVD